MTVNGRRFLQSPEANEVKRIVVVVFFMGQILVPVMSAAENPSQSIMFQEQDSGYEHLTTIPEHQKGDDLEKRCTAKAEKIEELKGKPQRRYRKECQRNY
jgi:hypothetical protein